MFRIRATLRFRPMAKPGTSSRGMKITSPAFVEGGKIPRVHTCEGDDLPPALAWEGLPPATQSLVLIVDDPDAPDPAAPSRTFVHWVVYNIPAGVTEMPAGGGIEELPPPARAGKNDFGRRGWGGWWGRRGCSFS